MKFHKTPLMGAYIIEAEPHADARGLFARTFCAEEFMTHGLETQFVQANLCRNVTMGVIRGMHFQKGDDAEVKLVRCVSGAIYDVIVDIRTESPTFLQWYGAELSGDNGLAMYVPRGFAHGYQSLTEESTVHYMVSAAYAPGSEGGLRFDDPALAIDWPLEVAGISGKDAKWPLQAG